MTKKPENTNFAFYDNKEQLRMPADKFAYITISYNFTYFKIDIENLIKMNFVY